MVRTVVVLAVAFCAIRNDSVSFCISDIVWKKLLELTAVFSDTAVDGGWRRHLFEDAVAVISSITVAERGGEIDTSGCNVLLIAVLPVEAENIFDGPEVTGFIVVSSSILNIVEAELVVPCGCDGCAGIGTAALEALFTVAVCVFLTTECLDAGCVEALDKAFEEYRFDVLVSNELGKCGQRYRFVVVDLTVDRTSIVACMGHFRSGYQRRPFPQGRQLLLNSRGLCDTTNILVFSDSEHIMLVRRACDCCCY